MRPANPYRPGPEDRPHWKHVCTVIDILIWVVFVVEFFPRVVLAEWRIQHVLDVLSGTGGRLSRFPAPLDSRMIEIGC